MGADGFRSCEWRPARDLRRNSAHPRLGSVRRPPRQAPAGPHQLRNAGADLRLHKAMRHRAKPKPASHRLIPYSSALIILGEYESREKPRLVASPTKGSKYERVWLWVFLKAVHADAATGAWCAGWMQRSARLVRSPGRGLNSRNGCTAELSIFLAKKRAASKGTAGGHPLQGSRGFEGLALVGEGYLHGSLTLSRIVDDVARRCA